MKSHSGIAVAVICAAGLFLANASFAQYPVRPIRLVVLIAPGGAEPWITTRADFAATIQRDYEKYGKLVKDIGARID